MGAVVAVGVVLPPLPYLPYVLPVVVAVGAGLLVAVDVVGEEAVVVELLPHAAKSTRAPNTRRQNMVVGMVLFLCIVSLSKYVIVVMDLSTYGSCFHLVGYTKKGYSDSSTCEKS